MQFRDGVEDLGVVVDAILNAKARSAPAGAGEPSDWVDDGVFVLDTHLVPANAVLRDELDRDDKRRWLLTGQCVGLDAGRAQPALGGVLGRRRKARMFRRSDGDRHRAAAVEEDTPFESGGSFRFTRLRASGRTAQRQQRHPEDDPSAHAPTLPRRPALSATRDGAGRSGATGGRVATSAIAVAPPVARGTSGCVWRP